MNSTTSRRYYTDRVLGLLLLPVVFIVWSCENQQDSVTGQDSRYSVDLEYIQIDATGPENPWAKFSGDLDGDGLNEIIIGGQRGPLVWYKYPDWTKYKIIDGGYDTVDGEVGDIDGDDDLDIVMGGIVWYENPGNLSETPDQRWNVHEVSNHPTHDIEISDLDKDGRLDIISRNQSEFDTKKGNSIHIWMNKETWEETILDCPHGEGIVVADLDGDGDDDIINGGYWFENMLERGSIGWEMHQYSEWHQNASVQVADLNMDGGKDIVLTPSELAGDFFRISWFEAPEDAGKDEWIEHILVEKEECVVHSLSLGDIDQNGYVDIIYAEMHQADL